jgi:hypothetical protein
VQVNQIQACSVGGMEKRLGDGKGSQVSGSSEGGHG